MAWFTHRTPVYGGPGFLSLANVVILFDPTGVALGCAAGHQSRSNTHRAGPQPSLNQPANVADENLQLRFRMSVGSCRQPTQSVGEEHKRIHLTHDIPASLSKPARWKASAINEAQGELGTVTIRAVSQGLLWKNYRVLCIHVYWPDLHEQQLSLQ